MMAEGDKHTKEAPPWLSTLRILDIQAFIDESSGRPVDMFPTRRFTPTQLMLRPARHIFSLLSREIREESDHQSARVWRNFIYRPCKLTKSDSDPSLHILQKKQLGEKPNKRTICLIIHRQPCYTSRLFLWRRVIILAVK